MGFNHNGYSAGQGTHKAQFPRETGEMTILPGCSGADPAVGLLCVNRGDLRDSSQDRCLPKELAVAVWRQGWGPAVVGVGEVCDKARRL